MSEVAVKERDDLVLDDAGLDGLEDIDQSDLMLPRVRVIQPTSKLDGPAGSFHNSLSGESKPQIHAVLLRVTKSRVCWDPSDLAAPPLCASDDARTPRAANLGTYSADCASCPMAQWGKDGEPPQCRLTYNFLAADLDDEGTPFILSLAGASVKNARKIVSVFVLKRKKLFSRPVKIESVEVKNDRGRYFEVVLSLNGGGDFDWRPYQDMYLGLKETAITADTESETVAPATDEVEDLPF